MISTVNDLMALPSYSIDELLTPNSSLTNVTSLPAGDTTRSLLVAHDALTSNINNTTHTLSPSANAANNTLPSTIDPVHGLLLGNTTAFDSITTSTVNLTTSAVPPTPSQHQQLAQDTRVHLSPAQQQNISKGTANSPSTRINDRYKNDMTKESDSAIRHIKGVSQSPIDLDDKEVAESMSCTANYQLEFEAVPDDEDDDEEEGDAVFMPIKANEEDEPAITMEDPLISPSKYGNTSLWSKSRHSPNENQIKGLNASSRQDIDDYSDPTETSDKDDDSTADEALHHSRIKRRTGRSPSSSQLPLNMDMLHAIRELNHRLTDFRTHPESTRLSTSQIQYDEKLERCCQRLEQLSVKVDRLVTFESTGISSRPNRPSPNTGIVDGLSTNEPQVILSDAHYDRLEAMLVEKIQAYVQNAMKSAFEPYLDFKDNLHKELAAKLAATDNVIKQTITQTFRSKGMIDSLSNAVGNSLQSTMITSYRDTFNQIVIPSFEKAALNMFQQTNDIFKRGTKEYLQEMTEFGRQQQRSLLQQREQMITEIREESKKFLKEVEKKNQEMIESLKSEMLHHIKSNLDSTVRETIQTVFRTEISGVLRDLFDAQRNEIMTLIRQQQQQLQQPQLQQQQQQQQQQPSQVTPTIPTMVNMSSRTSRTTTPITNIQTTPVDPNRQKVLELIRLHQYNKAFEFVLSASNLNLVLFLCEQIQPRELFSVNPCPLQIPVLLSLMQQLGANLTNDQDIKIKYLQECIRCLDAANPIIREHAAPIINNLNKKLYQYTQDNREDIMADRFKNLYLLNYNLIQQFAQQKSTYSQSTGASGFK